MVTWLVVLCFRAQAFIRPGHNDSFTHSKRAYMSHHVRLWGSEVVCDLLGFAAHLLLFLECLIQLIFGPSVRWWGKYGILTLGGKGGVKSGR